jgi:DNA polymerase-1
MINIWRRFSDGKLKTKMILQVHDELLFECPMHELEIIRDIIKEEMEGVISLSVPLLVDIHVGKNWAEAH